MLLLTTNMLAENQQNQTDSTSLALKNSNIKGEEPYSQVFEDDASISEYIEYI